MNQRPIKFRAWEKKLGEMIPVYDIQFHHPKEIEQDGIKLLPKTEQPVIINVNAAWRTLDEVELMQFTGLHDNNGKEVYDGDVIEFCSDASMRYVVVYKNAKCSFVGQRIAGRRASTYRSLGLRDTAFFEVIGNIYENNGFSL